MKNPDRICYVLTYPDGSLVYRMSKKPVFAVVSPTRHPEDARALYQESAARSWDSRLAELMDGSPEREFESFGDFMQAARFGVGENPRTRALVRWFRQNPDRAAFIQSQIDELEIGLAAERAAGSSLKWTAEAVVHSRADAEKRLAEINVDCDGETELLIVEARAAFALPVRLNDARWW